MIIEICLSFRVYLNCIDIYLINNFTLYVFFWPQTYIHMRTNFNSIDSVVSRLLLVIQTENKVILKRFTFYACFTKGK